jgi:Fic family protein
VMATSAPTMSSHDSLASFREMVEDFVTHLPKTDSSTLHLPKEHEDFKKTMKQVGQQATILEKIMISLKAKTNAEEGVRSTLEQTKSLLKQYQQELDGVHRRPTTEGVSAEEEAKLRSLRQEITPGCVSIMFFFYQLFLRRQVRCLYQWHYLTFQ